eukprot:TRINITY_DN2241_c0_g1_i1.p1 TRINITY_DN2241_c0_g1~~TRINITY_DN2241_c0_g1_i1.p1  ORF type:complete len:254 (+),score=75.76 TRINITY_DN2241_c0_g1_i1:85-846(+)
MSFNNHGFYKTNDSQLSFEDETRFSAEQFNDIDFRSDSDHPATHTSIEKTVSPSNPPTLTTSNVEGQKSGGFLGLPHFFSFFFHLLFKILAIVAYILAYYIWKHFVIVFVMVVTLLALDFWTTKNISGRILVGLRWWNEILENGENNWRFEAAKPGKKVIDPKENLIFWMGLIGATSFWIILSITSIFGLKWTWFMVTIVAILLNGVNVFAYWKCARVDTTKFEQSAKAFMAKQATNIIIDGAMGGSPLGSIQ